MHQKIIQSLTCSPISLTAAKNAPERKMIKPPSKICRYISFIKLFYDAHDMIMNKQILLSAH